MAIQTKDMTAEEAATFLRNVAEITARNSGNWENFQAIALDMIRSALKHVEQNPRRPTR